MPYMSECGTALNTVDAMNKIKSFLVTTVGWTLVDDHMADAAPYFVLLSHGESGKEDVCVQFLNDSSADMISVIPMLSWDGAGHLAVKPAGGAGTTGLTTRDAAQFLYWVYADLDHAFIVTKLDNTIYDACYVGLVKRFWSDQVAITNAPAAQGSNVVVSVDDASFLTPNRYYLMKDNANIKQVRVTAVNTASNPDTITIQSLPNAFAAGAKIGEDPQPVMVFRAGVGLGGGLPPGPGFDFGLNINITWYALNKNDGYTSATGQSGSLYSIGKELALCSDHDSRYDYVTMFPFVAAVGGSIATYREICGELINVFSIGTRVGSSEDVIETGSGTYKIFDIESMSWVAVREP